MMHYAVFKHAAIHHAYTTEYDDGHRLLVAKNYLRVTGLYNLFQRGSE